MTDETADAFAQHLRMANEALARAAQLAKEQCPADPGSEPKRIGYVPPNIGLRFLPLKRDSHRLLLTTSTTKKRGT